MVTQFGLCFFLFVSKGIIPVEGSETSEAASEQTTGMQLKPAGQVSKDLAMVGKVISSQESTNEKLATKIGKLREQEKMLEPPARFVIDNAKVLPVHPKVVEDYENPKNYAPVYEFIVNSDRRNRNSAISGLVYDTLIEKQAELLAELKPREPKSTEDLDEMIDRTEEDMHEIDSEISEIEVLLENTVDPVENPEIAKSQSSEKKKLQRLESKRRSNIKALETLEHDRSLVLQENEEASLFNSKNGFVLDEE